MKQQKFSFSKRIKSFEYAFNGLRILWKEEHNSRIHLFIALLVIAMGFFLEVSSLEWMALIFCIGFVITTEIINSCMENTMDFISKEKHDSIKKVKDLAAASVLISSLTAISVGLIIFIPKILDI